MVGHLNGDKRSTVLTILNIHRHEYTALQNHVTCVYIAPRYGIPGLPSGMYPPEGKLWYPQASPTYITFEVNSEGMSR